VLVYYQPEAEADWLTDCLHVVVELGLIVKLPLLSTPTSPPLEPSCNTLVLLTALPVLEMPCIPWHELELSPPPVTLPVWDESPLSTFLYILLVYLEDTAVNATGMVIALSHGRDGGYHHHRQKRSQQHQLLRYSPSSDSSASLADRSSTQVSIRQLRGEVNDSKHTIRQI
jgi:hypothetical protein